MNDIYPWQSKQWQVLAYQIQHNRLTNGYLFHGIAGLGKQDIACTFAQVILCSHSERLDLGCQCTSCQLWRGQNHPDGFLLGLGEQALGPIKIESIRELTQWLVQTPQLSRRKVALVGAAERMTEAAANALLKTLEEPPVYASIVLVSNQLERLPATLRSRCQLIGFHPSFHSHTQAWVAKQLALSDFRAANDWLYLAQGAPLFALQLATDPQNHQQGKLWQDWIALAHAQLTVVEFAERWQKEKSSWILQTIYQLIGEYVKSQLLDSASQSESMIYSHLKNMVRSVEPWGLFHFLDHLLFLQRHIDAHIHLNQQLVLEYLGIEWVRVVQRSKI